MKKIVYSHTLPPTNVRVKKNVYAFLNLGYSIFYYGINRIGHKKFSDNDFVLSSNLNIYVDEKPIPNGLRGIFHFLKFIKNFANYIQINNPDIIVITNEELFLVSFFLTNKLREKIVLDAIDALDLRSKQNFIVEFCLKKYVNYVRSRVTRIVEVEEFRSDLRPSFKNKTIIVKNTPAIHSLNFNSEQAERYKNIISHTFIYCSGSLSSKINGIELLIKAIQQFNEIKIVVAGFISDFELINLFEKNSKHIIFIGSISLEDSIYLSSKSLCYFAFYSPTIVNFKLAAPNKVYEAFMLGKPLLINSECLISTFCRENGFGFTSNYNSVKGLVTSIQHILEIEQWEDKSKIVKTNFKNNYAWEIECLNWRAAFRHLE